ncbi:MAG: DEAD/DEAH box helicase [Solirubrobacteraceae bacterium]|nr:DEAD/DEAH box helicase [Solirubrobacteraceae bacterium]
MTSIPTPADTAATFRELGVSPAAAGALEKRGYERPLPVQAMVLPDILEGRDILAKSPTGSGKTLAFMVPLLDCLNANDAGRPAALILAPTRELASQIVEESREVAHALALRVAAVYGGVGIQKQAREAARAHVIVATPGRLEDLLQRRAFDLGQVEILVLDEADRMLDMGFKPAIDRIVGLVPDDRQTLFFSATLDGEAGKIATAYTEDAATHVFAPPTRPITEMDHRFVDTEGGDKVGLLLDLLEHEERGLAIVFVRTKHGADRLSRRLDQAGVNAGAMHGGKTQGQRERALAAFERGKIDVLVATDVAARGIDIDDITHVINYDIPEDRETYVHRIGRTGRAGRDGIGITLVAPDQVGDMAEIARDLGLADRFEEGGMDPQARAGGKKKKGGNRGGGQQQRPAGEGRRHEGGGQRGAGRPRRQGYEDRAPRSFDDRGSRGTSGEDRAGFRQDDRGPRQDRGGYGDRDRGGYGDRGPRRDNNRGGGFRQDDRGPRGGGQGRGDNRGGYGDRDSRGSQGESRGRYESRPSGGYTSGRGQRDDRPQGGGGYGERGPRNDRGSSHGGPRQDDRGPRRGGERHGRSEGGWQSRGPRTGGPRRSGGGPRPR